MAQQPDDASTEPNRAAAEQVYNEGMQLYQQGTAESLRQAIAKWEEALPLWRAVGDEKLEASILNNLGGVYDDLGEKQKALEFYNQALPLFQVVEDKNGEAITLYSIAWAKRDQGNLTEALTQIEQAVEIIESLRTKIASPELRTSYFATQQDVYEFYIDLLMQLHQQNPNQGYDAKALHASERSRARSLLELLTEANADIRQGVEPQLLEQERTLQQKLDAHEKRRIELFSGNYTQKQVDALEQERKQLLEEYRDIQNQIRVTSPRYAALTQPQPLTLAEIQQQVLDEDTLLLQYSLGTERSYLWAVSKTGMSSYELPPREEIETAAKQFYELLKTPGFQLERGACNNSDSPLDVETRQQPYGHPTAGASLQTNSWINEGYDPPFASGILRGEGLSGSPFREQRVSSSVIPPCRGERGGWEGGWGVRLKGDGQSAKSLINSEIEQGGGVSPPLNSPTTSLNSGRISELVENRAGCEEDTRGSIRVENVKANKAVNQLSQILLAPVAEQLGNKRLLIVSDGALQYIPFAALPLPETSGENVVPLLANNEIVNLPAELVVLSACQTGLGQEVKGEGLVGLTRGFMYAGSPRVLVSLWNVNDLATSELMKRFYRKMLEEGLSATAALRAAQLEMQQETQWDSPYYWAAFTLQGEWR